MLHKHLLSLNSNFHHISNDKILKIKISLFYEYFWVSINEIIVSYLYISIKLMLLLLLFLMIFWLSNYNSGHFENNNSDYNVFRSFTWLFSINLFVLTPFHMIACSSACYSINEFENNETKKSDQKQWHMVIFQIFFSLIPSLQSVIW